jgi:hypothetical protein
MKDRAANQVAPAADDANRPGLPAVADRAAFEAELDRPRRLLPALSAGRLPVRGAG